MSAISVTGKNCGNDGCISVLLRIQCYCPLSKRCASHVHVNRRGYGVRFALDKPALLPPSVVEALLIKGGLIPERDMCLAVLRSPPMLH
jgi:hypothetical protein